MDKLTEALVLDSEEDDTATELEELSAFEEGDEDFVKLISLSDRIDDDLVASPELFENELEFANGALDRLKDGKNVDTCSLAESLTETPALWEADLAKLPLVEAAACVLCPSECPWPLPPMLELL